MKPAQIQNILIIMMIFGFALMEYVSRRYRDKVKHLASKNDTLLEVLMFISLVAISQPIALLGAAKLGAMFAPEWQNILTAWPWWGMLGLLLIFDDMTQYWWHRLSHSPLLWPLHRAHHSGQYMSIRVTYRNNFFYYLLMPGLWLSGLLLYMGLSPVVYAGYVVVKLCVIMGAHCAWAWDEPLYKIRPLRPVMWVVERTISTPATHWAHHAITNEDGVGHYKGNFSNMLFIWDLLFGSAKITRQYPALVGLRDDQLFGHEKWYHQMFYPVLQSKRTATALKFGGIVYDDSKPNTVQ